MECKFKVKKSLQNKKKKSLTYMITPVMKEFPPLNAQNDDKESSFSFDL